MNAKTDANASTGGATIDLPVLLPVMLKNSFSLILANSADDTLWDNSADDTLWANSADTN